ncbi:HAD family phosphatase [Thioalkalivibrio sp. ALE23]|uniref:histidinol-phosphatase n=1 Tax=Thioalkalivibrio sp. ALE23 TaxID=1265495 RepID=UPI00037183EC|nr:HAD family phosphatase [Thioalkalivibrio sp. ALE23]
MTLALFDLDNTLLAGDSDHAWNETLIARGAVDRESFAAGNDRFYEQYLAGTLDIFEFCRFAFAPLAEQPRERLEAWREAFMQEVIEPMIAPAAHALLQRHREAGDELVIITATNQFVTAPIAQRLGVPNLLATIAEERDGRFTGEVAGTPCFQHGKVDRLHAFLADHHDNPDAVMAQACFYSDSRNDIPLLERVGRPVAVDPDPTLDAHAREQGWERLTLRAGAQPVALD